MILSVTDLAVARGGLALLQDVSLALGPGQALALRGANGIGKTSLLRTIAGLLPSAAGRIEVAAEDVAYAGHANGVKDALSVDENLRFWSDTYGTTLGDRAKSALDLAVLSDRPARQLSAGQSRRLGLARLVVSGRRLWLLDEPTASLDAASVALFADLLSAHLAGGGAALVVTHGADLAGLENFDLTPHRVRAGAGDADEAFGGGNLG